MGAKSIPDPTTAGDFCRRFELKDIEALTEAINETRLGICARQSPTFTKGPARIDADGSLVSTDGECKQGMNLSYNGIWGYHPLLVTFANTGEVFSRECRFSALQKRPTCALEKLTTRGTAPVVAPEVMRVVLTARSTKPPTAVAIEGS